MAYIINDVKLFQHGTFVDTSIVVKENRIYSIHLPVGRLTYLKMKADQFIMTPENVMVAGNLPVFPDENYFTNSFIAKGVSTIIVPVPLQYGYQLAPKLEEYRMRLSSSPLDYLFAPSIPQNLITPNVIRFCKKEKLPAIFININDPSAFRNIAWSWIKQAAFPYNPVFIPSIDRKLEEGPILEHWCQVLVKEKIPHLTTYLNEASPLSFSEIKKIGIYPQRGDLHSNGELSYNLFAESSLLNFNNGIPAFDYDKLIVTVLKGKVIRAGNEIDLSQLEGQELKVPIPGFFASN